MANKLFWIAVQKITLIAVVCILAAVGIQTMIAPTVGMFAGNILAGCASGYLAYKLLRTL